MIETALDFMDQGKATATWTFTPEGDGTQVHWGFDSDMGANPIGKIFGLMMDGMLGPQYEQGLSNLKKLCEEGGTESYVSAEASSESADDTETEGADSSAEADDATDEAGQ